MTDTSGQRRWISRTSQTPPRPGMRRSVTTTGVRRCSSSSSACSAVVAAWQSYCQERAARTRTSRADGSSSTSVTTVRATALSPGIDPTPLSTTALLPTEATTRRKAGCGDAAVRPDLDEDAQWYYPGKIVHPHRKRWGESKITITCVGPLCKSHVSEKLWARPAQPALLANPDLQPPCSAAPRTDHDRRGGPPPGDPRRSRGR